MHTSTRCFADRLEVVHVVEGRDGVAVGGRQVERVGNLANASGESQPYSLLREPQRGQRRRARRLRIAAAASPAMRSARRAHLSTSPITVSSEPTIAIMSAISASVMQVAVASSATNDGARNFTRHGLGPPSETT